MLTGTCAKSYCNNLAGRTPWSFHLISQLAALCLRHARRGAIFEADTDRAGPGIHTIVKLFTFKVCDPYGFSYLPSPF